MKNLTSIIGWLLLIAALAFYVYGAYEAIIISWTSTPAPNELKFPEGLDAGITSINALLLTNLGAVLGISVTNPQGGLARRVLMNRTITVPQPTTSREQVQMICVIVFLIILIACMITYIHDDFVSDAKRILPFVSQGAKMFIGVVVAYLAFVLGVKSQPPSVEPPKNG